MELTASRAADDLRLSTESDGLKRTPCAVFSIAMTSGDVYVQATATPVTGGPPKSVLVLVPRQQIEDHRARMSGKTSDENRIAQHLAEPLAMNVFTHRADFGRYRLVYSFSSLAPFEVQDRSPEFAQGGLKAWIL